MVMMEVMTVCDGGGDRSGGDNDVCNYDDGSSGLTAMEEVVEVKVMATEEVITKVQMSVVVEVVESRVIVMRVIVKVEER